MSDILAADAPDTPERVVEALRDGNLVVLPTDSVYGVVADAFQPTATRRLLRARGAGRSRPLPVLIRSPRQVVGLSGDVSEAADRLMAAYWPGPLTMLLRETAGLSWDLGNTLGTVALRIPTDDALLAVIKEVGPLACSAACRRGQPHPTTVAEAQEQLGDKVACYVDAGPREGALSTIVDGSRGDSVEVLREGAVPTAHVDRVAAGDLAWGARPDPAAEDAVAAGTAEDAQTPEAAEEQPLTETMEER